MSSHIIGFKFLSDLNLHLIIYSWSQTQSDVTSNQPVSCPVSPQNFIICTSYCFSQDLTIEGKIEAAPDSASAHAESTESCEEMFFNPNVFTEFKLAGSPEVNFVK